MCSAAILLYCNIRCVVLFPPSAVSESWLAVLTLFCNWDTCDLLHTEPGVFIRRTTADSSECCDRPSACSTGRALLVFLFWCRGLGDCVSGESAADRGDKEEQGEEQEVRKRKWRGVELGEEEQIGLFICNIPLNTLELISSLVESCVCVCVLPFAERSSGMYLSCVCSVTVFGLLLWPGHSCKRDF